MWPHNLSIYIYSQWLQPSYSEHQNARHLKIWRISCITFQSVKDTTTKESNIHQNVASLKGERGRRRRWCKNSFSILQLMMEDRLFILDQSGLPAVQSLPPPEMWRVMKHMVWQLRLRRAPSPPVMYHSRTKLKSAFKAATLPSHCACEGWRMTEVWRRLLYLNSAAGIHLRSKCTAAE